MVLGLSSALSRQIIMVSSVPVTFRMAVSPFVSHRIVRSNIQPTSKPSSCSPEFDRDPGKLLREPVSVVARVTKEVLQVRDRNMQ